MGFSHSARTNKEKSGIESRIVLDELFGYFVGVPMGFVVGFEVFERTVGISFGDSGLVKISLILLLLITGTAYGNGRTF